MKFLKPIREVEIKALLKEILWLGLYGFTAWLCNIINWREVCKIFTEQQMWECFIEEGQI